MVSKEELKQILDQAYDIGICQVREEISKLFNFVFLLKPNNVMEIGADRGGSFYLWSRVSAGVKISVDLPGGPYCDPVGHDISRTYQKMKSWCPEKTHIIIGDSHDPKITDQVSKALGNNILDFLFIDGDHTYKGVKQDFETYSAFVRQGGWIAFHDINDSPFHRSQKCGVGRFWKELAGKKIEFSAGEDWGGIGLMQMPKR